MAKKTTKRTARSKAKKKVQRKTPKPRCRSAPGEPTDFETRFAMAYCVKPSQKWAAKEAGSMATGNALAQVGFKTFRKPHVQEMIRKRYEEIDGDAKLRATEFIKELRAVAFSDVTDYQVKGKKLKTNDDVEKTALRAVSSFKAEDGKSEIRMHSKVEALRLYAKIRGLLEGQDEEPADSKVFRVTITHEDKADDDA